MLDPDEVFDSHNHNHSHNHDQVNSNCNPATPVGMGGDAIVVSALSIGSDEENDNGPATVRIQKTKISNCILSIKINKHSSFSYHHMFIVHPR